MFIKLPAEEMKNLDGRHLIYLATAKAKTNMPDWDDQGVDTVNGNRVVVDYVNGGVHIFF